MSGNLVFLSDEVHQQFAVVTTRVSLDKQSWENRMYLLLLRMQHLHIPHDIFIMMMMTIHIRENMQQSCAQTLF